DARAAALLRRDLLPTRAPPGDARVDPGAAGDLRGLGAEPRGDPRGRGAVARAAVGTGPAARLDPAQHGRGSRRGGGETAGVIRRPARWLRRCAEVPTGLGPGVPAAARRAPDHARDSAGDGRWRHTRPDRGWLLALQRRRRLDGAAFREDAL